MKPTQDSGGSAGRWGPLFGARADDWAETWEGPHGYGTPVYEYVLDRAKIGSATRLLDCGCGAGRFARMAANRGANVAGIDAAKELVAIATRRTPEGDFRVGDLESLPWPDASFDWVTGFNSFQFADDNIRCWMASCTEIPQIRRSTSPPPLRAAGATCTPVKMGAARSTSDFDRSNEHV
jgi:SAM-dependent methyltransferase